MSRKSKFYIHKQSFIQSESKHVSFIRLTSVGKSFHAFLVEASSKKIASQSRMYKWLHAIIIHCPDIVIHSSDFVSMYYRQLYDFYQYLVFKFLVELFSKTFIWSVYHFTFGGGGPTQKKSKKV